MGQPKRKLKEPTKYQPSPSYIEPSSNQLFLNTPTGQPRVTQQETDTRKRQLEDLVNSLESELTQKLFQHKTFLEEI